jgi:hypothetical protein
VLQPLWLSYDRLEGGDHICIASALEVGETNFILLCNGRVAAILMRVDLVSRKCKPRIKEV